MSEDTVMGEPGKKDRILFYALVIVLVLGVSIFLLPTLFISKPLSLDELHQKNVNDKLDKNEGYLYNGHSFVFYDGLWYGLIAAPDLGKVFSIPFHYGPREVAEIIPDGKFNGTIFNSYQSFFMTFDPLDEDLQYIAGSIGETNGVLINAFGKNVVGACSKNTTDACHERPIVDCDSTPTPVIYFLSENATSVVYDGNCAIISGNDKEIFRATDRMLFDILGII